MSTDNVVQFESEAQREDRLDAEREDRLQDVLKHSGIYVPVAATSGQPIAVYQRVCADFELERPTVQVLVDGFASTDEVVAQLRRVVRWLKDREASELRLLDDTDKPRMHVSG